MKNTAISVKNISKKYLISDSVVARILSRIGLKSQEKNTYIQALHNVSFEVNPGDSVAIIGKNGSGKSTLLEIITGTLKQTSGNVKVGGRVSALLELGSGFNPEFTGRQNVILNGLILGLSKKEITERFDEILEFSEIMDAIDRPVKSYSSGMMMRLAFSVQVICNPEILIIDEALSVGDFFFQQKCIKQIKKLQKNGTTLLFVSHDMHIVRELCTKGLLLDKGKVHFWGDNLQAISHYLSLEKGVKSQSDVSIGSFDQSKEKVHYKIQDYQWDNLNSKKSVSILAVGVFDEVEQASYTVEMGRKLIFKIIYRDNNWKKQISDITLFIKDRYGRIVTAKSTYTNEFSLENISSKKMPCIDIYTTFPIEAGEYSFQVNIGPVTSISTGEVVHATPWLGPLKVSWDYKENKPDFFGSFDLPIVIKEGCA